MKENEFKQILAVKYVSWRYRFFKSLLGWGSITILLFSIYSFYVISYWVTIGLLLFYIYYIFVCFNESKYFIVEICESESDIEIHFILKSEFQNKIYISKERFSVEWYDSVKGNPIGARIIFKDSGEEKIVQYVTGKWDRKLMSEVYNKLVHLNR